MSRYRYDVVLRVGDAVGAPRGPAPDAALPLDPALTTDPLRHLRAERLVPALEAHLAEHLPDYMRPAAWVFHDALPRTRSGKLDGRALPPPRDERPPEATAEPPGTAGERAVAAAFAEALGVAAVGRRESFFALGGHSLLAVQVVSRVEDATGVALPLTTLYGAPTVAALGALVDAAERGASDALDSDADADAVPLTATDLAFHYGKQVLRADASSWYQVLEVELAPVDLDRLRAAIRYAVDKHPLARGRLSRADTFGPSVFWDARERVREAPLDVEHAADAAAVDVIRERLVRSPLAIDRAPACRFTLARAPGTDHLLLRYNHGAIDASGLQCLLGSVLSRYLGRPDPVRRVLPFTTDELLAHYGRARTRALDNNELAHLAGALPGSSSPGWLKTGLRMLGRVRTTQLRGEGGAPGDDRPDAVELAFTAAETRALDAGARGLATTLDRLFLVGILTGATAWNRDRGETARLEAYWAVNLRPPRYLASVVANLFAWSRVRVPVDGQWAPWRREMLDPAADFLLRGALDWAQAIEGFDQRRMPDFLRRRVLAAAQGLNPALFVSNTISVGGLDAGPLARAAGVRAARLHSRFGATDKPILVLRRPADVVDIRMIYPRARYDAAGAARLLRQLMDATLAVTEGGA
ncbi:MAG: hypothetical protein H6745_26110 [Deltaproteobacteria bacterium]|nr:hypothetical protein [Deltaproteobacteria bacterium]